MIIVSFLANQRHRKYYSEYWMTIWEFSNNWKEVEHNTFRGRKNRYKNDSKVQYEKCIAEQRDCIGASGFHSFSANFFQWIFNHRNTDCNWPKYDDLFQLNFLIGHGSFQPRTSLFHSFILDAISWIIDVTAPAPLA